MTIIEIINEDKRSVLNRAKSSVVYNASATQPQITLDFPVVLVTQTIISTLS